MNFFPEIEQWGIQSKKGLLCGIFGCNEPVDIRCKICNGGYCKEHKNLHFHSVDDMGILLKDE